MTYRATIGSAAGLYVTGGVVAGLCIFLGLLVRPTQVWLLVAGFVVFAWLVAIRVRCRVQVSMEQLEARTLLGEARIKWSEIVSVRRPAKNGYWAGRLYGPAVLEFTSSSSRLRVNFKLFPRECVEDVMRYIPEGVSIQE
ncbi:MAG: PH domain-containing protein [Planctomycetota bacterium]